MTAFDTEAIHREVLKNGFTRNCIPLAYPGLIGKILDDVVVFDDLLTEYNTRGWHRIPYIITDAISELLNDQNVSAAVSAALDSETWVMWGPNIRRATPNDAHLWHTDLESDLWPTITAAIGLSGCRNSNATWFLPGTHNSPNHAPVAEQVNDFGNGRFYLFNAHCLHRSDASFTKDRIVLFTHFQRADASRIPLMLDHKRDKWSHKAAPFVASPKAKDVLQTVARVPLHYRARCAVRRVKKIFCDR